MPGTRCVCHVRVDAVAPEIEFEVQGCGLTCSMEVAQLMQHSQFVLDVVYGRKNR